MLLKKVKRRQLRWRLYCYNVTRSFIDRIELFSAQLRLSDLAKCLGHYECNNTSINSTIVKPRFARILVREWKSLLDFTTNLDGGNLEATKTLLENGIDKIYFSTAFKWACWRNNIKIAEYLLENGVDFKSEITPKSELLFWICSLGYKEIVKLLLGLGVDFKTHVKFKGKVLSYNGSPLDRAIETNQIEIVELINAN
ncbi:ankyrin repeat domain-containing protein [Paenibacillus turicensis]|uniref:ankyrin repeat domain-containing protein n=1 Tax=Paenibacillus turicensis TaxID=160487 RepID=UPI003D2E5D66